VTTSEHTKRGVGGAATRGRANLRPEQIERSAAGSLLKKAADKDDCANIVATICRNDTMTGQTVVIDSGRIFH
jgi:3-oxoacyl-[acyl-carrier protein] reductase